MPKKTKKEPALPAASPEAAPASAPAAHTGRKRAVSPKPARKAASKKTAPAGTAKKETTKRARKRKAAAEPSDADIRTRAYFIAERRMQLAIPGDSAHDWLEAKRQLIAEASQVHA